MKKNFKQSGYVMLLSVIIVGAVALTSVIAISSLSLATINATGDLLKSKQAKALADACAETALQVIRDSQNFSGNGNLSLTGGSCSYTVINNGGQNRQINSTGISSNVFYKVKILINQINPQINIAFWQEVGDFN